jgi:hypothetical protein
MKNLTTLLAIAALTTTLGLAGCKKKKADDTAAQPAAAEKTNEMKPDDKAAAKPDNAAPAAGADQAKPAEGAAPTAAGGDLPKECQDYKAAIEKLASCDKLPQATRDSLKQAYDTTSAGWANLPAEAKANLASSCKTAADAVMQSAKATCGW